MRDMSPYVFLSLIHVIINEKGWDYPVFLLGAQVTPHPRLIWFFFVNEGRGVVFGSNQTSFLTLQGILNWSPTLRAPFLPCGVKKPFEPEISTYHKKTSW